MPQVTSLIHISDIHIRPLDRHLEYNEVFQNVYNYIRSLNKSKDEIYIFLCGDILHTKEKLLSETIILLNSFISQLSKLCKYLIVIPGNHDSYKSADRHDSIYFIDKIGDYENLIYFNKNSCLHPTEDFNIIYNHLFDNVTYNDFVDSENFDASKKSILLYHGLVTVSGEFHGHDCKKVDDFAGYDYVLLGDVHQMNFLTKRVVYPGSLIQQNFGESNVKGLVHWQLNKKGFEPKFVEIENNYAMVSIVVRLIDNELSLVLYDQSQSMEYDFKDHFSRFFRKHNKIRLIYEVDPIKCNEDLKEQILSEINATATAAAAAGDGDGDGEVTLNVTNVQFKNAMFDHSPEDALNNLDTGSALSSDNENALIRTVLEKQGLFEDRVQELLQLHSEFKQEVNYSEEIYNSSWRIKSLEFKNVFIYGDDYINKIHFNDSNEIIGILGNNAIGKSCILYIILYTLFGSITKSKSFTNKNILNKNAKQFYIKMEIEIDNCIYVISRFSSTKLRQRKNVASLEESLEFYKKVDESTGEGRDVNLTCSTKSDTEKLIKTTLGITNKDDFVFTNVISNIIHKNILTMSNAELDESLGNLFNTKIYKLLSKYTKDKIKELDYKKANVLGKIDYITKSKQGGGSAPIGKFVTAGEAEDYLKKCRKEIGTLTKKQDLIKKQLNSFSNDVKLLVNEFSGCIQNEIQITQNKLNKYGNKILLQLDFGINESELSTQLAVIKRELQNFGDDFIYERPDNYDPNADYAEGLVKLNLMISEIQQSSRGSGSGGADGDTGTSGLSVSDIKRLKTELSVSENSSGLSKDSFSKLKLLFSNFYKISKTLILENNQKLIAKYKALVLDYTKCINYEKYLSFIDLNEQYKEKKALLEGYALMCKLDNLNTCLEYEKIQSTLEDVVLSIQELNKEILVTQVFLDSLQVAVTDITEFTLEVSEIDTKLELLSIYKNLVSDKCLPKIILQNTLVNLQKEANEIIYSLCNLTIEFETNDSFKWNILVHKNDMTLNSEQCSGYERFIVNVALKIAFDKYKYYSGIKMFFIDEGLDCVSEENYEKLDTLFLILKNYYKNVLVISHNEQLKQKVERIINIVSENNGNLSKIK